MLAAVQQVHAYTNFATLPRLMVGLQSQLVPNELSTYTLVDKRNRRMEVVHDGQSIDTEKLTPQLIAYYHEPPIHRHCLKIKDAGTLKISDFLTQSQFRWTGLYNEFYRLLEVSFQAVFFLFNDPALEVGMVLNRKHRDFTERDRAIADLLRPHFAQAYSNLKAFAEARARETRTDAALASSRLSLIYLTDELRIERMTGQGAQWLESYFGRHPKSPVQLPDTLLRWVADHRDRNKSDAKLHQFRTPLTVDGAEGSLTIRLTENPEHQVTLLLSEQRRLPADAFIELGLTTREGETLVWICKGKSNQEIARILGISVRTVHKHVEHILKKLGVENRMQAQRLGWEMQMS